MIHCSNCGQTLPADAHHCPYCGQSLDRKKSLATPFIIVGIIMLGISGVLFQQYLQTQSPASATSIPVQTTMVTKQFTQAPTAENVSPVPTSIRTATKEAQPTITPEPPNEQAEISCANRIYFVNLRRTPGISSNDPNNFIFEIPCGEIVELVGESRNVDGLTWWKVSWNGYTGWIADHTQSGKQILIFDP